MIESNGASHFLFEAYHDHQGLRGWCDGVGYRDGSLVDVNFDVAAANDAPMENTGKPEEIAKPMDKGNRPNHPPLVNSLRAYIEYATP